MPARKPKVAAPPDQIRGEVDRAALDEGCHFDAAAGAYVCEFIETFCCHSQGKFAGTPFKLLDWQRDYITRLYGWKRADGTRRFRTAYLEVPKKNGKSTLIAAKALYHLLADKEPTAEIYINAYDKYQAGIIYREASRMVKYSPHLKRVLETVPSSSSIYHEDSESRLMALSKDAESKDGFNASYTVFDELHRQRTSAMWDMFEFAGEAREQPLLESITTAGHDRQSVCWRQHDHTRKVNSGLVLDTSHFGVIYAAEATDDIEDPRTWAKANPSLGHTLKYEDFKAKVQKVLANPIGLNNFLRLRLNIWTNASERFLARDKWDACGLIKYSEDDLVGLPCFGGLDLSLTTDLTALALLFPGSDGLLRVLMRFWAPEEGVERRSSRDGVNYEAWARAGVLTLTPGDVVDYDWIRAEVSTLHDRFNILNLFVDKQYATQLSLQIRDDLGVPLEFLRQGFLSLTAPTRELERLVISRKLAHGSNPLLDWMADNAVASLDAAGGVKLDKAKSTKRIDGLAAIVNAVAAWTAAGDSGGTSVYEERGILWY